MVIFPKLASVIQVPLVEPINSYYMVIFQKITSVTRVHPVEPINSYYMVISPKSTLVTRVPLVEPINSYHMIIFPKLTSVTRVPLVEPINSYYTGHTQIFWQMAEGEEGEERRLIDLLASLQVKSGRRIRFMVHLCAVTVTSSAFGKTIAINNYRCNRCSFSHLSRQFIFISISNHRGLHL